MILKFAQKHLKSSASRPLVRFKFRTFSFIFFYIIRQEILSLSKKIQITSMDRLEGIVLSDVDLIVLDPMVLGEGGEPIVTRLQIDYKPNYPIWQKLILKYSSVIFLFLFVSMSMKNNKFILLNYR